MLADVSISSAIVNSLKKEKRIFISFYVQYTSPAEFWQCFFTILEKETYIRPHVKSKSRFDKKMLL